MISMKGNYFVSICIPTFNGEKWIEESLNSALLQTYRHLEVVIVDDASTDGTLKILRSMKDPRIKIHINRRNKGLVNNWNECLKFAKGEFIKPLFQDDVLHPDCVERMIDMFSKHESLGLVFSKRDIIVSEDIDEEYARKWLRYNRILHDRFSTLIEVNKGIRLFLQQKEKGFQENWIGEPSSVMVKSECFERLGVFNNKLRQTCDIEMWLRIMYYYDVGFIDENLSVFRVHPHAVSAINHWSQKAAFDRVWLLEGLLNHNEIQVDHPEIRRLLKNELWQHRGLPLRPSFGLRNLLTMKGVRETKSDVLLYWKLILFNFERVMRVFGRLW